MIQRSRAIGEAEQSDRMELPEFEEFASENELCIQTIRTHLGSIEADMAWIELWNRYYALVFSMAMRRLRNREDAMDMTQDVFFRAAHYLHQLEDPKLFVRWIKRIVINLSINHSQRAHRDAQVWYADGRDFFDTRPNEEGEGAIGVPEVVLQRLENIEMIRRLLPQICQIDRDVIQRFYFDGWSLKEIAEESNSPVGTIKRRLHTARARMGDKIREQIPDFDLSDE